MREFIAQEVAAGSFTPKRNSWSSFDPEFSRKCGERVKVPKDLFDKPLAISFWFTRGGDCIAPQDAFDDAAAKYGDDVNFLSLNVRDSRETVQGIIDERGWKVPVGLDPDGAVSNLFRVGGCPTLLLAYPGGIIYDSPIAYEPDEVDGFIEDLLRASRERAETSR